MLNEIFKNIKIDNLEVGKKYGMLKLYNTIGLQNVSAPGFKEVLFKILDSKFKYSIVVASVLIEGEIENGQYNLEEIIGNFYKEKYSSKFTLSEQFVSTVVELNCMLNKNFSFEIVHRKNENYVVQESYLIMSSGDLIIFDCKISLFCNKDKSLVAMYYHSNDKSTMDKNIKELTNCNFYLTHSCFNEELKDEDIISKVKTVKSNLKKIKDLEEIIYNTKPIGSYLYKLHDRMIGQTVFIKEDSNE